MNKSNQAVIDTSLILLKERGLLPATLCALAGINQGLEPNQRILDDDTNILDLFVWHTTSQGPGYWYATHCLLEDVLPKFTSKIKHIEVVAYVLYKYTKSEYPEYYI